MNNQKSLNITIQRYRPHDEYIHGRLFIEGTIICDTLENANGCVPSGEYEITLLKCKQYSRKMICLNPHAPCDLCPKQKFICSNSVLPCYCPMIKPGNGVHGRLDGSIIVGVYNCLGSIIHPKSVFDSLYERIRKSISRGNQVILCVQ